MITIITITKKVCEEILTWCCTVMNMNNYSEKEFYTKHTVAAVVKRSWRTSADQVGSREERMRKLASSSRSRRCVTAESGSISAKVAAQSGKTLREIAFSSRPLFYAFWSRESCDKLLVWLSTPASFCLVFFLEVELVLLFDIITVCVQHLSVEPRISKRSSG